MPAGRRVASFILGKIVKKKQSDFTAYGFGVYLEASTGYKIDELRVKVVQDRLKLSQQFLDDARAMRRARPSHHRSAVSRAYYSLYHAARAVAYFVHKGDDFQDHAVLPSKLPGDFPRQANWQNELASARLDRNEADYEPYPRKDSAYAATSAAVTAQAEAFLTIVRRYLRRKGCAI